MGPKRGRPRRGELADMTIHPHDEDCHEPSSDQDTEKIPYTLQLAEGHKVGVVQTFRAGTTELVSFSVWQDVYLEEAWRHVVRIDSWHGNVHRHDFTSDGNNRRTILEVIPTDHPERVLERWRNWAEDIIMSEWDENVRRWRGDR